MRPHTSHINHNFLDPKGSHPQVDQTNATLMTVVNASSSYTNLKNECDSDDRSQRHVVLYQPG